MRRIHSFIAFVVVGGSFLFPTAALAATDTYTATPAPATSTARPAGAIDPTTSKTIPAPTPDKPTTTPPPNTTQKAPQQTTTTLLAQRAAETKTPAKKTDTTSKTVLIAGFVALVVMLGLIAHLATRKLHHEKTLAKSVAALPPIETASPEKS